MNRARPMAARLINTSHCDIFDITPTCRDNLQVALRIVKARHHRAITKLVDCCDCAGAVSTIVLCQNKHWDFPLNFVVAPPGKSFLINACLNNCYYYTSDSLWKIWLVESIQLIHNSLWTWHDKCNICCRYCIYHVKFNVCLVTKPFGVFSSETKWLNSSLLFLSIKKRLK